MAKASEEKWTIKLVLALLDRARKGTCIRLYMDIWNCNNTEAACKHGESGF